MDQNYALILDDEKDRLTRFRAVLHQFDPNLMIQTWRAAPTMMDECTPFLPTARIISLDHDLYPWPGDTDDPGDGLQVAKFLVAQSHCVPTIVHTSNSDAGPRMQGELEFAGWNVRRVLPVGADWIESIWALTVRDMIDS